VVRKIISGGQTGADQGGLEAGRELGLETGGTAPLGWTTEVGPQVKLLKSFGLVEAGIKGYPFRTKMNVLNSDGTIIFGNVEEPGSKLTASLCLKHAKPCFVVSRRGAEGVLRPKGLVETFQGGLRANMLSESRKHRYGLCDVKSLVKWLKLLQVLNVAGNRESRSPGLQALVKAFLVQVLRND